MQYTKSHYYFIKRILKKFLFIGDGPDRIYGINARKISNGVDLNNVYLSHIKKTTIHLYLLIANLMFWHGYDRLVRSIAHYEGEYRVNVILLVIQSLSLVD
jgi:hypothetical protein